MAGKQLVEALEDDDEVREIGEILKLVKPRFPTLYEPRFRMFHAIRAFFKLLPSTLRRHWSVVWLMFRVHSFVASSPILRLLHHNA
jgi:hypothetical protein